MAIFSGIDLRIWRNSKGVSAEELGLMIGYDASTIYRIEKELQTPGPKEMMLICNALGDISRWDAWMRTAYPESYGRIVPEPVPYGLEGSILKLKSELCDLEDIMRDAMRDSADGNIDSIFLKERLKKELGELISAANAVKGSLEGGGNDGA